MLITKKLKELKMKHQYISKQEIKVMRDKYKEFDKIWEDEKQTLYVYEGNKINSEDHK